MHRAVHFCCIDQLHLQVQANNMS